MKGKKPPKPVILSLLALEKEVRDVLSILGLLGTSCSEVTAFFFFFRCEFNCLQFRSTVMKILSIQQIRQQLKDKALIRAGLTEEQIQQLIEQRNLARKNKEYESSDKIRKDLSVKGIALMDESKGTIWRPCEPEEDAALMLSNCSIKS